MIIRYIFIPNNGKIIFIPNDDKIIFYSLGIKSIGWILFSPFQIISKQYKSFHDNSYLCEREVEIQLIVLKNVCSVNIFCMQKIFYSFIIMSTQ